MAFDGIKSKLVPDEKLIACTIDRINEKSNAKLKYSIGWVKCAAFALVLAIIISVLPLALKNNNSNNPIVPPQTEAVESTEPDLYMPATYWEYIEYMALLKIKKYGNEVVKRVYEGYLNNSISGNAVVVEVEAVFRGEKVKEANLLLLPVELVAEENKIDYIVGNFYRTYIDGSWYYTLDETVSIAEGKPRKRKFDGAVFKNGVIEFNDEYLNKYICGKNGGTIWFFNDIVDEVHYENMYSYIEGVEVYPDYYIEHGMTVEKANEFLEKVRLSDKFVQKFKDEIKSKKQQNDKGVYS